MKTYFKELKYLISLLFTKQSNELKVVIMKHFPFSGYSAMSWCVKLITRKDIVGQTTMNHERIHLEQALFFGSWIKYYWKYFKDWLAGFTLWHPMCSAYYTIPFEMEAYANQDNPDYHPTKDSYKKYIIKNRHSTFKKAGNWIRFCKSL